jgi:hypothetical protein
MRDFGGCFLKFAIEEFGFCLDGSTRHWVFEYVVLQELQSSLGFDTKKLGRRLGPQKLCISCAE